jgi:peptidoglycan-associated lipoprotein
MLMRPRAIIATASVGLMLVVGCGKPKPRVEAPAPVPEAPPTTTAPARPTPPPPPPTRVEDAQPRATPLAPETVVSRSLEELNRNSPLKPVFFALDSAELDNAGRQVASANVELLKRNPTWAVTIEGHCDDRGTAEYNLALGERRAEAVRAYFVSLGLPAGRLKTVSYGEEFPFDSSETEAAWAQNRRAHFVITSQ